MPKINKFTQYIIITLLGSVVITVKLCPFLAKARDNANIGCWWLNDGVGNIHSMLAALQHVIIVRSTIIFFIEF